MSDPRPALITGACGFLGRHLVRELLQQGRQVKAAIRNPKHLADLKHPALVVIPVSVDEPEQLAAYLSEDLSVFHLAGARANPGTLASEYERINVEATLALARAATNAGVHKFIYVSTALIFRNEKGEPATERDYLADRKTTNPYLQSRLKAMHCIRQFHKKGLALTSVCPSIIYGPDHPSHPNRITQQIRQLTRTRLDIVVDGGARQRDLVYIDDVVDGISQAEQHGEIGELYILSGEAISHRDFNQLIFSLSGLSPRLRVSIPTGLARFLGRTADRVRGFNRHYGYADSMEALTRSYRFGSQKAAQVLSYAPRPLKIGLGETLNWLTGKVSNDVG